MRDVQFGLVLPAEFPDARGPASLVVDAHRALELVAGHFDSVWVVDHLQSGEDRRLEGFTTLTYFAALHPEFRFGNSVLCQSFRNPALLAKMGATLQLLSGGRFILGLGAGCNEEDYRAYGYDFPRAPVRVRQLEETIQIIKAVWTVPRTTFEGEFYRVRSAHCEPRPDPVPPLMIGAFRPKMLGLAAKHADWWNVSSSGPKRYSRMAAELERACLEVGRSPSTIRRTWGGGLACAATRVMAEELAALRGSNTNDFDDFDFVGTPTQIAEQMRAFMDMGVDYFMLDAADFPRLDGLEMLIRDVIPALRA
jgi:alkanesulfonate monooxygenase SsuD/methylene tetrahydromethanopterin reductase-like flavin-dependent oxidoreductase (luciferase family)